MNITLLNCVNELLLTVGELDVPNLNSPVARKARMAIQRGISAVAELHRWSYLMSTVVPSAVVGSELTLPTLLREVHFVSFLTNRLAEVSWYQVRQAYIRNTDTGTPRVYARRGQQLLAVYPAIAPAQLANITVVGTRVPVLPTIVTDVIDVPDNVYACIMLHAEVIMHRIHTDDVDALQAAQAEFETKLHYARTLDGNDGRFQ